jgi:hypothetical protein
MSATQPRLAWTGLAREVLHQDIAGPGLEFSMPTISCHTLFVDAISQRIVRLKRYLFTQPPHHAAPINTLYGHPAEQFNFLPQRELLTSTANSDRESSIRTHSICTDSDAASTINYLSDDDNHDDMAIALLACEESGDEIDPEPITHKIVDQNWVQVYSKDQRRANVEHIDDSTMRKMMIVQETNEKARELLPYGAGNQCSNIWRTNGESFERLRMHRKFDVTKGSFIAKTHQKAINSVRYGSGSCEEWRALGGALLSAKSQELTAPIGYGEAPDHCFIVVGDPREISAKEVIVQDAWPIYGGAFTLSAGKIAGGKIVDWYPRNTPLPDDILVAIEEARNSRVPTGEVARHSENRPGWKMKLGRDYVVRVLKDEASRTGDLLHYQCAFSHQNPDTIYTSPGYGKRQFNYVPRHYWNVHSKAEQEMTEFCKSMEGLQSFVRRLGEDSALFSKASVTTDFLVKEAEENWVKVRYQNTLE